MTSRRLADAARRHGLELVGVTTAAPLPEARKRMREAVDAGRMGRMGWMGGERPEIDAAEQPHKSAGFNTGVPAPAGAGLDLLTEEVRRWLSEHGIVRSFSIRVTGPGQ